METRDSLKMLDKAREMCSPASWYELAKRLHVKNSTLTRCRLHGGTLDNEAAYRLAQLLGQDPLDVIRVMEYERARDPDKRAFWEKQLPRLVPVVAILGIITGVNHITDGGPQLASYSANNLYIMRSAMRRLWGLLTRRAARMDGPTGLGCFAT